MFITVYRLDEVEDPLGKSEVINVVERKFCHPG